MKIQVKPKVVVRFLLTFWSCFFILWFFFKKLPDIIENNDAIGSVQSILIKNIGNDGYISNV